LAGGGRDEHPMAKAPSAARRHLLRVTELGRGAKIIEDLAYTPIDIARSQRLLFRRFTMHTGHSRYTRRAPTT
jgi:hypothetical protein